MVAGHDLRIDMAHAGAAIALLAAISALERIALAGAASAAHQAPPAAR